MTFFELSATMIGICVLFAAAAFLAEILSSSPPVLAVKHGYKAADMLMMAFVVCAATSGAFGVMALAGGLLELALPHL